MPQQGICNIYSIGAVSCLDVQDVCYEREW